MQRDATSLCVQRMPRRSFLSSFLYRIDLGAKNGSSFFFLSPSLKIRVEKYVGEWVQYRPQLLPDIRKLCCTAHNNLLHSQFIHYLLAIFPPICCCMLLLMLVLVLCCLRAQHVYFGRMWVAEASPPSASDALAFQWPEGREPPRRLVSDSTRPPTPPKAHAWSS